MRSIIYLDNAATTALDPQVLEAMIPYMSSYYGNPSSSYSIGRESKMAIELARKKVAELLGVKPTTIYFTSGGTESNNAALTSAVRDLGCTHIITSPIEHHAVLHTVEHLCNEKALTYSYVAINETGKVDLQDLENQLAKKAASGIKCLVSLMHANNEIGAMLNINLAGEICNHFKAIFHSDCVQTIGHYPINFAANGVHFASASGHKFHGPKGTGILYVSEGTLFKSFIHGGGQERKKRAGTENLHGIIGFAKALELAMTEHETDRHHISSLSSYMRHQLMTISPQFSFNSEIDGLYTVLSVNFPKGTNTDLILALLDRDSICVSGGSACSSGDDAGSHVITSLQKNIKGATIRFSFSKLTNKEDIDLALSAIANILQLSPPTVVL
ncbi:cysteine desulfurase family protein [Pedobacter frigiditerrae]|uniref:cysteine desulfurase family protein n=1 Tax=Pedobacter frigiditerrae TaxID=2530452 RepID=UPI00293151F5|nr:cysteine desulfurase family protein [Pedobacter frigiditerrae]